MNFRRSCTKGRSAVMNWRCWRFCPKRGAMWCLYSAAAMETTGSWIRQMLFPARLCSREWSRFRMALALGGYERNWRNAGTEKNSMAGALLLRPAPMHGSKERALRISWQTVPREEVTAGFSITVLSE